MCVCVCSAIISDAYTRAKEALDDCPQVDVGEEIKDVIHELPRNTLYYITCGPCRRCKSEGCNKGGTGESTVAPDASTQNTSVAAVHKVGPSAAAPAANAYVHGGCAAFPLMLRRRVLTLHMLYSSALMAHSSRTRASRSTAAVLTRPRTPQTSQMTAMRLRCTLRRPGSWGLSSTAAVADAQVHCFLPCRSLHSCTWRRLRAVTDPNRVFAFAHAAVFAYA